MQLNMGPWQNSSYPSDDYPPSDIIRRKMTRCPCSFTLVLDKSVSGIAYSSINSKVILSAESKV